MSKRKNYLIIAIAIVLLAAGLIMVKGLQDPSAFLNVLSYVLVGLGCILFGRGMGQTVSARVLQQYPETERKMQIERFDERNIVIRHAAKSKAYDVMIYLFGALIIAFGLMEVGIAVILLLLAAYLFVLATALYYKSKYEQEM